MSHKMTEDVKECYKDVAHISNEYILRMLLQGMETFASELRVRIGEDYFLTLKKELHRCKKAVKIRHEEVVAASQRGT